MISTTSASAPTTIVLIVALRGPRARGSGDGAPGGGGGGGAAGGLGGLVVATGFSLR